MLESVRNEVSCLYKKIHELCEKDQEGGVQEQLKLFLEEWKHETEREREELEELKRRVGRRRELQKVEEAKLAEILAEQQREFEKLKEEERLKKEEEKEERLKKAELRRAQLEEESVGRGKRNFAVVAVPRPENVESKREPSKEELKEAALASRIHKLELGGLGKERLRRKAEELWEAILKLETECYDLEEVRRRQEYDHRELQQRQKQQLRHKAMKLGLEPEALMGKYPPKILTASKYERRPGLKPFGETRELFEGGIVRERKKTKERRWWERQELFTKRGREEVASWLGGNEENPVEDEEAVEKKEVVKVEHEEDGVGKEEEVKEDEEEEVEEEEEEEVEEDEKKEVEKDVKEKVEEDEEEEVEDDEEEEVEDDEEEVEDDEEEEESE